MIKSKMEFKRGEAMSIGRKEYALQMAGLLAKRVKLNLTNSNSYPNNPEIIFTWSNSVDGSYINLIERGREYSISYDLGMFNFGNASIPDVVEMLKKDGVL